MRLRNESHGFSRRLGAALVAISLLTGLSACGGEQIARGYVIDDALLSQIKPGSSAEQVVLVLGTPSSTSTVGGQTYYYISQQTQRSFAFQNPSVVDQRVIAVYLNKQNRVDRLANYGMQDGVVFDFITRSTPSGGLDQSFIRQIFSTIGQ